MKTLLNQILTLSMMIVFCNSATAQTNVNGFISVNTNWGPAGNPYIVTGNVLVMHGITLTIEPGTIVKFNSSKALQVDGLLVAIGTQQNRITFTSNQAVPAPGDWASIHFADTSMDVVLDLSGNYVSGSAMQYCDVLYGGDLGSGAIHIEGSSPLIGQCRILHSGSDGIQSNESSYTLQSSVISNCTGYGLSFAYWCGNLIQGDTISNNLSGGISFGGLCASVPYILITGNYFSQNAGHGALQIGSVYVRAVIRDNDFIGNTSTNSGIVNFPGMSNDTVQCNRFVSNIPNGAGQAVVSTDGYPSMGYIGENLFDGNAAINGAFITRVNSGSLGSTSEFTFTKNKFINNSGSHVCYFSPMIDTGHMLHVTNNEFTNNTGATEVVYLDGYQTGNSSITFMEFINNSFNDTIQQIKFSNAIPYGSPDVYIDHNYWGSTNPQYISSVIYDYFDNATQTVAYYNPVLSAPVPNNNPCSSVSSVVDNGDNNLYAELYPNPANTMLTIFTPKVILNGKIELFAVTGEIILQKSISNSSSTVINLENIPKGIYFIRLFDEDKLSVNKVIVQ